MKYTDRGRSRNLEDRRGSPGRRAAAGGAGLGGIGLVLLLVTQLLGGGDSGLGDILGQLAQAGATQPQGQAQQPTGIPEDQDPDADLVGFVSFVLDDTQLFWAELFEASGRTDWRDATLVLFEEGVQSGCGFAPSAVGPFYCSLDDSAYLDLTFFDELGRRFGAPGDLAQAYVLAHEIAHHVQNVLGISADVRAEKQADPDRANELSVRQELQADCFSGLWASTVYERGDFESGDLEEALGAAEAVGDDRIQAQAGVPIDVDTWTHGSSEQRQRWFLRGFETGDPNQCDTFSTDTL